MPQNDLDLTGWEFLAVDDEPDNLTLLEIVLNFHNVRVTTASSGEEGLARISQKPFKVALVDIQMPRVSGWDVIKTIRAHAEPHVSACVVIAVTAYAMIGDRERVLEAGFDGYISKPIDAATFMDSVKAILAQHQQKQEAVTLPQAANPEHDHPSNGGQDVLLKIQERHDLNAGLIIEPPIIEQRITND
jgi:CheY-like chemotaxis protein